MSYTLHWSKQAELNVAENMDYLAAEWDEKVLLRFLSDIEKALQRIKDTPLSYPLHDATSNVRKYKINKHIVLYYKIVDGFTIDLITFWNNKRDPKSLKF